MSLVRTCPQCGSDDTEAAEDPQFTGSPDGDVVIAHVCNECGNTWCEYYELTPKSEDW